MNNKVYLVIAALIVLIVGVLLYRASVGSIGVSSPTPVPVATPAVMSPSPTATTSSMVVDLLPVKPSTRSGTAKLEEIDGKVKVTIDLASVLKGSKEPAHIHKGSCDKLDVSPLYPLEMVVDGKSETTINVSMKDLLAQLPLGLNVHKSAQEAKVYVACGDLKPAQ